jgi:two-component system sensor histidine kinase KdpD
MKNPAFFRFEGPFQMHTSRSRTAAGLARAPLPVLWIATLGAPAIAYALARGVPALHADAIAALFLFGIALVATSGSALHALIAAGLAFVLYRAETAPRGVGGPVSPNELVVLGAFLGSAAMVAWIAAGPRREIASLTVRTAHGAMRRELAERLAEQSAESGVVRTALAFLESSLQARVVLWLGERLHQSTERDAPLPPHALEGPRRDGPWLWLPLNGVDGRLGAVGIARATPAQAGDDELAHSLSSDIAHSLVRVRLSEDLQRERVANESERLCTALLASVSHDLRAPLTTIMGAAESLRTLDGALPPADREALLSTIEAEGRRLDRYIQNLVDVTRIGDGQLCLDAEATTLEELIASAVGRLRRYEPDVRLDVRIDANVPVLRVHAPLIEQALFNVLHNASKFSPPGAAIGVHASAEDAAVAVDVVDLGPGIPHDERERVFDMFYSADRGDAARSGTGLGLAISQSIVRAHGGEITAHAGPGDAGTRMRLLIPTSPSECGAGP